MTSDVDRALERARAHLRKSMLEGLEGIRALLEAAVHASGGAMPTTDSLTGALQTQIEELISTLRHSASFAMPRVVVEPLSEAVEAEIRRWEERAKNDPDARLVLRAFLGMRELIWEFSNHRAGTRDQAGKETKHSPPKATPKARDRVQRFDVED